MKLILVFLAVVLSLKAKKCDNYVVGQAWYHSQQYATDEGGSFEGCKKGCFWNETYTEDGVKKCELCSDIDDEETCLTNGATCQWKSGKCKSQTCPSLAKSGITVGGAARSSSAIIINRIESYRHQVKLEDECLARTALEQNYSKTYWADYEAKANYPYFQDNCPGPGSYTGRPQYDSDGNQVNTINLTPQVYSQETCTDPCSRWGSEPPERKTKDICEGYTFGGCVYVDPAFAPFTADCISVYQPTNRSCDDYPMYQEAYCKAYESKSRGCAWKIPVDDDGIPTSAYESCVGTLNPIVTTLPCTPFTPNVTEEQNCQRLGCKYISGNSSNRVNPNDQCVIAYDSYTIHCQGFTPGSTPGSPAARTKCQELGCTFALGGYGGGACGSFQTDCPTTANYPPSSDCELNVSLKFNSDDRPCDDRLPPTPDGTPLKACRLTLDIQKQRCEFNYEKLKSEVIFVNDDGTGGYKPGSQYEKCIQDQKLETDDYKVESDGSGGYRHAPLAPEDRIKKFGYATGLEYCDHQKKVAFDACQDAYDQRVEYCHGLVAASSKANPTGSNHGNTKASRTACHRVYGCMYSLSNERCSVWSVWAFILTLILTILVVVGGLGVAAIFLLPILKRSSA